MQAQLEAAAGGPAQKRAGQQSGLQEEREMREAAATLERIRAEQQLPLGGRQLARWEEGSSSWT